MTDLNLKRMIYILSKFFEIEHRTGSEVILTTDQIKSSKSFWVEVRWQMHQISKGERLECMWKSLWWQKLYWLYN